MRHLSQVKSWGREEGVWSYGELSLACRWFKLLVYPSFGCRSVRATRTAYCGDETGRLGYRVHAVVTFRKSHHAL